MRTQGESMMKDDHVLKLLWESWYHEGFKGSQELNNRKHWRRETAAVKATLNSVFILRVTKGEVWCIPSQARKHRLKQII